MPTKAQSHAMVAQALEDKRLARQPCESCGDPLAQAHHDDYAKPLDVRWLCATHHRQWHADHGEAPGADPAPSTLVSTRMPADELERLKALAAADRRSVSNLVRRVLSEWLRDQEAASSPVPQPSRAEAARQMAEPITDRPIASKAAQHRQARPHPKKGKA